MRVCCCVLVRSCVLSYHRILLTRFRRIFVTSQGRNHGRRNLSDRTCVNGEAHIHTVTHTLNHTLLPYPPLVHSSRTLLSYPPLIHSSHTLLSYTPLLHSSHTLLSYTPLIFSPHYRPIPLGDPLTLSLLTGWAGELTAPSATIDRCAPRSILPLTTVVSLSALGSKLR
jgi:hypothetical protein